MSATATGIGDAMGVRLAEAGGGTAAAPSEARPPPVEGPRRVALGVGSPVVKAVAMAASAPSAPSISNGPRPARRVASGDAEAGVAADALAGAVDGSAGGMRGGGCIAGRGRPARGRRSC